MRRPWFVGISIGFLVAFVAAQPVFAAISNNTIDPTATLSADGRHVTVTGPIECTAGDTLVIRITVTEASTGAIGQGHSISPCTGEIQQFSVTATAVGAPSFAEGSGQACALGVTRRNRVNTDILQWCAVNGVTFVTGP